MKKNKNTEYDDLEIDILDLNEESLKEKLGQEVTDIKNSTKKASKKAAKKIKKEKKKKNKEFAVVSNFFLIIFIAMACYFCYFVQFESQDFVSSSYNPRLSAMYDDVIRGSIMTSDGVVVAKTEVSEDGSEERNYPYSNMYAHAIGYSVNGMAGVELDGNFSLLKSHENPITLLINAITGEKSQGDTIVTTLDSNLQSIAYYSMGSYDGAVLVLEPDTGKILAMVSKPDYDPNMISSNWNAITSDSSSSVLLNRVTQGLYPPGSTFKIFTALEYLSEGGDWTDSFTCNGQYSYDDTTIHCYNNKVHGDECFLEAFGNSCNSVFAEVGLSLDMTGLSNRCEGLLFNQELPTRLSHTKKASFTMPDSSDSDLIMQTAIGQGNTLVTPLHMCMVMSAIANDGILIEPYIIDHTQNADHFIVKQYSGKEYGEILTEEEASTMQSYLRYVVTDGTGTKLDSSSYTAYGKTGTAEYNSNKDDSHSWFVGFAENDGKKIAIAVIMEGAGSGSAHAVPLAKTIFDAYFE